MRPSIPIVTYDTDRVENPSPTGEVSFRVWLKVRNTLVATCRRHGPTGPMGMFDFESDGDFFESWALGDKDCVYYLLPDQYNDIDRYHYIEILRPEALTKEWVSDVMDALLTFRGWGLGVSNIKGGYLLIFSDKIMVSGTAAAVASDIESILREVQPQLNTPKNEGS